MVDSIYQADKAWLLDIQRKLYTWSRANPDDAYRDMWNWVTKWSHRKDGKPYAHPGQELRKFRRRERLAGRTVFLPIRYADERRRENPPRRLAQALVGARLGRRDP